jgi:creatinine amidohydrolase
MCERAAARLAEDPELGALILPTLPYGVTRYARAFAGPIHVEEDTLHAMVTDVCRSMIAQGFPHVVIVNNHFEPEHVQTLHRACDTIEAELDVTVGYLDLTRRERSRRLTEEFIRGECHAGRYETSLVLADRPELVRAEVMARLPHVPVNLAAVIAAGMKEFEEMGLTRAYCGSPAEATADEGEAVFETLTDMLVEVTRALVRGEGGRDRPGLFGRV